VIYQRVEGKWSDRPYISKKATIYEKTP
jgi:hypothetical protein